MCSTSSIVNFSNHKVTLKELEGINQLIYRQGPDGEGFFMEIILLLNIED